MRDEWMAARRGKFTCSRFGDLMGQGRNGPWSQTALTYMYQVAAERCGSYADEIDSRATRWGHENERAGLVAYQGELYHTAIEYSGEVFRPFGDYAGGSPDAVIGHPIEGVVDVKCPYNPAVHMRNWHTREVPREYIWQLHGHMLVTGAMWCDFVSFDPRITDGKHHLSIVRVERDEEKLTQLTDRLAAAEAYLQRIFFIQGTTLCH